MVPKSVTPGHYTVTMEKHKAPGKHYRKGLSLKALFKLFPDDSTAEKWFVENRWPNGIACPTCGSVNVQTGAKHKTMPYRCRDCRKRFSARTGTPLEASNLGFQTWLIAIYLIATSLKGVSSMKLHRDLEITQRSAWHLAHRLRQAWGTDEFLFAGPLEVDETYIGGKRRNMPKSKRERMEGRGPVGKTAVAGAKDRATNKVSAQVVDSTDADTLQGFISDRVVKGATVYTDEHCSYEGLPFPHESVKHSVGEYVRDQAHINGVESFWSMLKRGYYGTYHRMSPKHLQKYTDEFSGRHNMRELDTLTQMVVMVRGLDGKRLCYKDLVS